MIRAQTGDMDPAAMRKITELRRAVEGRVASRNEADWSALLAGRNPALRHDPAVVVEARDAADVAAAITWAGDNGLSVNVQATGHGPVATVSGGLLIRTHLLQGIDVDRAAGTVRVEAGVTWSGLMARCAADGLAPLGMASVADVGVVGYTVGGGMGPLGRAQGYAADHVRSVELIDAEGSFRVVDHDHDSELFWAIRGGRFGLGVVAAMTLPLRPAPRVASVTLRYDQSTVAEALTAYATWQGGLPAETSSTATLFSFPDLPELPEPVRGQRFLQIHVVMIGGSVEQRSMVDALAATTAPNRREEARSDPAGWLNGQPAPPVGPTWQRGVVVDRLDDEVVSRLLDIVGPEAGSPWRVVEIRPMGAALGGAAANAVGARSDGVLISTVGGGDPGRFSDLADAHAMLVDSLADSVECHVPIAFLGTVDADHPATTAWSLDLHTRLMDVRRSYDPAGMFAMA